jgi:hypothetical protein
MITEIEINTDETSAEVLDRLQVAKGDPKLFANMLISYISRMAGGLLAANINARLGDVKASGTVTCVDVQATETVTVDGVALTGVASGATGPQFNVGVKAALEVQDLTYTAVVPGAAGNSITIAYTGGATAGAEVVSVVGNAISIQIETGVSTATQVKAAFDAESDATDLAAVAVSGTGGTAQVVAAADALEGGVGSNALCAASLASAINANATLDGRVVAAASSLGVVTITAIEGGELGNSVSLASSDGGQLAVSGAALSGGVNGTNYSFAFHR